MLSQRNYRDSHPKTYRPIRLTHRHMETIDLVFWARLLRADQLQIGAGYPLTPTASSSCRRCLTHLTRHQYLDTLPRRVDEPAIYLLTRRSRLGNQLLKERWGEQAYRRQMGKRVEAVEHTLAINDVRVRLLRACRELGFTLKLWQTSAELYPILKNYHLIPDAYCQIERQVGEKTSISSFFLYFVKVHLYYNNRAPACQ